MTQCSTEMAPHAYSDGRKSLRQAGNPLLTAQCDKRKRDGLVQGRGGDVDGVADALAIEVGGWDSRPSAARGQITRGKYDLDVVGHYGRPDIFQLHVDEQPKRPVTTNVGKSGNSAR